MRYFDYMRNHTYNLLKGGFRDLTEADVAAGALFLPVSLDAMNNKPEGETDGLLGRKVLSRRFIICVFLAGGCLPGGKIQQKIYGI